VWHCETVESMTSSHWYVLFVYLCFTLVATLLAVVKRWIRPTGGGESVWRKYPTYIIINLCFLAASWSPFNWHILTGLLAILGSLASWEIVRSLDANAESEDRESTKQRNLLRFYPLVTLLLIVISALFTVSSWFQVWLIVFMVFMGLNAWIGKPDDYPWRALGIMACFVYIPVSLAFYLWLRKFDAAGFIAVFLYLTIATNDAMAQITGELLGRRALVPRISPSKTIEGAMGGILFAGAMGAALSTTIGWSYFWGTVLGFAVGLAGLSGDLTASVWKRSLGLKNFSALLGAQGGVLDRFDGLIFAAPVFYLLILIVF